MHSPLDHAKRNHAASPSTKGDRRSTRRHLYAGLAIGLIAVGSSVVMYGVGRNWLGAAPPIAKFEHSAAYVREGNRIRIPEGSPLRRLLTVQDVASKEVARDLVIPAVVEADPSRLVKVLPPLAGRVTALKVQLGERVEAGQQILVLDSSDLRTAYADYDRAKALLDLAVKNRDRLRSLGVGGAVALKDVQQAEADFVTANAEYQRAEARLLQVGVDPAAPNKSRIVIISAPMAGSVLDLAVAPGAYWNDTTVPLLTIADLSSIFVTANLPEKDTSRIAEGQPVEVALPAYPGEVFKSRVAFINDVLDADTRRTKVRIAFQNPKMRLKPGMFANVTFFSPKEIVPIVPINALVLRDEASQVFVEVAPWIFEARQVEIRFQQGDQAVIQAGVKASDRVIVKGGVLLND